MFGYPDETLSLVFDILFLGISSKVLSLKSSTVGAFVIPFRVLSRKICQKIFETQLTFNFAPELAPLNDDRNFKLSCPQNMILVPLRSSFQNF